MKVMLYYLPLTPKTLTRQDLLYKEKIYEIKLFILKYVILILVQNLFIAIIPLYVKFQICVLLLSLSNNLLMSGYYAHYFFSQTSHWQDSEITLLLLIWTNEMI